MGCCHVTDADSDTITQYAFWDTGGNGHWAINGVAQLANTEIDVSAANLSQVSYVFGPGGSPSDTLYVRANDGMLWGTWTSFSATATNQAPTVSASNVVTVSGQTFAASNLFSATDADGDTITKYAEIEPVRTGHPGDGSGKARGIVELQRPRRALERHGGVRRPW
jgi:hypothetical protein